MLHNEPLLDRANHRLQRLELSCQYDQAARINGQSGIAFVRNNGEQLLEPLASLRSHNPELGRRGRPVAVATTGLTQVIGA